MGTASYAFLITLYKVLLWAKIEQAYCWSAHSHQAGCVPRLNATFFPCEELAA